MTPYEINVLLHISAMAGPFIDSGIPKTPLLAATLDVYAHKCLIEPSARMVHGWQVTKLGHALVNNLCAIDPSDIQFCPECGKQI